MIIDNHPIIRSKILLLLIVISIIKDSSFSFIQLINSTKPASWMKIIVEPSVTLLLAAILENEVNTPGKKVGIILSS